MCMPVRFQSGVFTGMCNKTNSHPEGFMKDPDGDIVLCAVSAYEEKYYFNPQFDALPDSIKDEIRTISILFVEDVGGRFVMSFDGDGSLLFKTDGDETDYNYDEIGAALLVKEMRMRRRELFESLELFCKVVILGHDAGELLGDA